MICDKTLEQALNFLRFKNRYPKEIVNLLYPTKIMTLAYELDNVESYTIQMNTKNSVICLLCPNGSELLIGGDLIDHCSSDEHLENARTAKYLGLLNAYHICFTTLEIKYQSHQVYFRPNGENLNCILCKNSTSFEKVQEHIESQSHMDNFIKKDANDTKSPLLIYQLQCYNINDNEKIKLLQKQKHNIVKSNNNNGNSLNLLPDAFKFNPTIRRIVNNLDKKNIRNTNIYFCDICHSTFYNADDYETHFTTSQKRHQEFLNGSTKKISEYECMSCNIIIFGDDISLENHLSLEDSDIILTKFITDVLFSNSQEITNFAINLKTEAVQVYKNVHVVEKCCAELTTLLSRYFVGCKAFPFGSRIAGVGNNESNLDIFIDIGDMYMGTNKCDQQKQREIVMMTKQLLLQHTFKFKDVFAIPGTKVPIVKMFNYSSNLRCDISFIHGLAVENTNFIRWCIVSQPVIQILIIILKKWLSYTELKQRIKGYSLSLLVIFFMQKKGWLFSVKEIISLYPTKKTSIYGWETVFFSKISSEEVKRYNPLCSEEIHILLGKFFRFYSLFDFGQMVVCPFLGKEVKKTCFRNDQTPPDMTNYTINLENGRCKEFKSRVPMCLQDPFDLGHNTTKNVTYKQVSLFKELCSTYSNYIQQ